MVTMASSVNMLPPDRANPEEGSLPNHLSPEEGSLQNHLSPEEGSTNHQSPEEGSTNSDIPKLRRTLTTDSHSDLNLLHLNVNSLRTKRLEVTHYLHHQNIHIACFNETLHNDHIPFIQGYHLVQTQSKKPSDRGTLIAIRDNIPFSELTLVNPVGEVTGIKVTLHTGQHLHIITTYESPSNDTFPTDFYSKLFTTYDNLVLLGDLNAKHTDLGCKSTNGNGNELLDLLDSTVAFCLNDGTPTCYPNNGTTPDQLDYCLISPSLNQRITDYKIGDDLGSDHLPQLLTIATTVKRLTRPPRPNLKKADWTKYRQYITDNLHDVNPTSTAEIDQRATSLTRLVATAANLSIPKTTGPRRFKLPQRILKIIRQRRKLRRIYQRTRNQHIRTLINTLQRKITDLIKTTTQQDFDNKVTQLTDNKRPQDFWKTVKRIMGKKAARKPIPTLTYDGTTITSDQDKANCFRDYFQTVHTLPQDPKFNDNIYRLANFIRRGYPDTYSPKPDIDPTEDADTGIDKTITGRDIRDILRRTSNTSPGEDQIQYVHLKAAPQIFFEELAKLYTASFQIGYIPKIWKQAVTILIPKPGKPHQNPKNYRPISLLPVLGKCLEKIIAKRLSTYLEKNKILPPSQAGFRRKRNTTDQLFRLIQSTTTSRRKGLHTMATFFDAEKAFDRMWHEGLLLKMRKFNIPKTFTRWIANFLQDRQARYKVGDSLSRPLPITTGTPQGSTISPILFIMYVADIPQPETRRRTYLSQFADDIAIWATSIIADKAEDRLQRYIDRLENWCNDWRIVLNPDKSQVLYIKTTGQLGRDPHITYNNKLIPVLNRVKYLGVTIDNKLDFTYHHNANAKRLRKQVSALYRLAGTKEHPRASPDVTLKVYKTMTRPIIEYAAPTLIHLKDSLLENYERTQRRACRIAHHLDHKHPSDEVLDIAGLPTIRQRFQDLHTTFLTNCRHKDRLTRNFIRTQLKLRPIHRRQTPLEGWTLDAWNDLT